MILLITFQFSTRFIQCFLHVTVVIAYADVTTAYARYCKTPGIVTANGISTLGRFIRTFDACFKKTIQIDGKLYCVN